MISYPDLPNNRPSIIDCIVDGGGVYQSCCVGKTSIRKSYLIFCFIGVVGWRLIVVDAGDEDGQARSGLNREPYYRAKVIGGIPIQEGGVSGFLKD